MEWNKAKQIAMKGKVDAEAKKLAKRLGAHSVYVVAHFADDLDPDALHSMSGGFRHQIELAEEARVTKLLGEPN